MFEKLTKKSDHHNCCLRVDEQILSLVAVGLEESA